MSNVRIAIFRALIVLTLIYSMTAGIYYSTVVTGDYSNGRRDYVSNWESRLIDLKREIPASEKGVGYISDWDMVGYDKDVYIELVLTKYTLAPILVEKSLNHEWIVANSTSSEFLGWVAAQITEPYTIQDFGSGIYLIHKGVQ